MSDGTAIYAGRQRPGPVLVGWALDDNGSAWWFYDEGSRLRATRTPLGWQITWTWRHGTNKRPDRVYATADECKAAEAVLYKMGETF